MAMSTIDASVDHGVGASFWNGKTHSYRPSADWRSRVSPKLKFHEGEEAEIDPATYEVIRHRMWMINLAHGETITRISGSPMISALDFNMSILAQDGDMLLSAPYVQYLNTPAPLGVKYIMENYSDAPGIYDGDIFCCNDPWIGACHQMDVLIACPIFFEDQLVAWVANAGHQYDLGGIVPGGWPQNAEDAFSDPTCMPPFKLVEQGTMRKDLEALYVRQSRMPDLVALDLRAQIAGVTFAREQLLGMCEQFGVGTVKAVMSKLFTASQNAFKEKLLRIPDGTWSEVRYIDEALPGDRGVHRTQINITKRGDRLIVDNKGTDAQTLGTNGLTYATWSGSLVGTLAVTMAYEQLFAVGGAARQVEFQPEPGLLTCIDFPGEASGGILQVVNLGGSIETIIGRMLATDPELRKDAIASSAGFCLPVLSGYNDRGTRFGQALKDSSGGGSGARSTRDGVETSGATYSPLSMIPNIEQVEQWYPVLCLYRYEGCDGGGAGKWRGGVGPVSGVTPYRAKSIEALTNTSGQSISTHNGMGLAGAYPSPASHYLVLKQTDVEEQFANRLMPRRADEISAGDISRLRAKSNGTPLVTGDVFELRAMGGGGYGDPLQRDPERVAVDVRSGYVSSPVAHDIYGVVLNAEQEVDAGLTRARRAAIMAERAGWQRVIERPEVAAAVAALPVAPARGEPPRSVHELLVAKDVGNRRELACAACDEPMGGYHGNFKHHLLMHEGPVTQIPTNQPSDHFLDVDMVLRRFCCPGCHSLMAQEVARASDPISQEMALA